MGYLHFLNKNSKFFLINFHQIAQNSQANDQFHQNQLKKLGDDEMDLKAKIEKFKEEEINHKNIAYESGATNKGLYSIMDKVIRTGSRIAITISEKI